MTTKKPEGPRVVTEPQPGIKTATLLDDDGDALFATGTIYGDVTSIDFADGTGMDFNLSLVERAIEFFTVVRNEMVRQG